MSDLWPSCGHGLLAATADGRLALTAEFLRAYLLRPEMRPEESSCDAERRLHARIFESPLALVPAASLTELADPDMAENYRLWLGFRDRLAAAETIEDAYLRLFVEPGSMPVPPLFVDHLAQVIVRRMLDGTSDPFRARAGELFFRAQRATLQDHAVMLADEETVEMHARSGGLGELGRRIVESQTPLRHVTLDVLGVDNADTYWARAERHDVVLDLTFGRPGLDALARMLEAWVAHMLDIAVSIQPVARIRDDRWVWHVGLDVESTAIMNALYRDEAMDDTRLARILALFRLEFRDASVMRRDIAGRPVYLGLARDGQDRVRLKPQNLLVNLPLAARA
ncbi:MAG: hypothetical protein JNK67_05035 [Alphaproteobacteria bacterium]|nr:hypothetical protein [Alphaproteobacteria bacterium]